MKKNRLPLIASIYAVLICALLFTSVLILLNALNRERRIRESMETLSPVYVYLEKDQTETVVSTALPLEGYWAREYREKIGIFKTDGSLYFVLDTYVKTLPKADQGLLKEGIYLEDELQLNRLIEDYS